MSKVQGNDLAGSLKVFFGEYLPGLRGMSPHTIQSYRDTFVLLLRYIVNSKKQKPAAISLKQLDAETIIAFLNYLENDRGNCVSTRNVRLAAIHAYFNYMSPHYPEHLEQALKVLGIPFKRSTSTIIDYLDYEEMEAILESIDCHTCWGRRDYALLATMFNTGARVQEILDLCACHLQLDRPYQIRILGKGKKFRFCPLWSQTAVVLKQLAEEMQLDLDSMAPVFTNRFGKRLTRFGVRYILNKYYDRAKSKVPSLTKKRIHPHSIRHSTAVHLLKSGVDIISISHWLGHASVTTTNRYAVIDMEMKQAALAKVKSPNAEGMTTWKSERSVLDWLEAL